MLLNTSQNTLHALRLSSVPRSPSFSPCKSTASLNTLATRRCTHTVTPPRYMGYLSLPLRVSCSSTTAHSVIKSSSSSQTFQTTGLTRMLSTSANPSATAMESAPLEDVAGYVGTAPYIVGTSNFGDCDPISGLNYHYLYQPFGTSATGSLPLAH